MSSGVEIAKSVVPSGATPSLQSGSIVAARFLVDQLLGEGGMGAVWSAQHLLTKKAVALKVLKEPASPDLVRRFVREARALSAVRHPNVIEVHDVVSLDSGLPAMVMDLLEGETLASRLERTRTIPPRELVDLMLPLVSALGAIHRAGIVHRDLKPDNIFLAQLGDGRVSPMLLDFGVCKLLSAGVSLAESGRPTAAGRMMGTLSYMAPEQVRGDAGVDARADVWALGVVLYECLSGQPPFTGETMADLVRAIASAPVPRLEATAPQACSELVGIVSRMLVRDRSVRVRELDEVRAALLTARDAPTPLQRVERSSGAVTATALRRPRRITMDVPPVMTTVPPPAAPAPSAIAAPLTRPAPTALTAAPSSPLVAPEPPAALAPAAELRPLAKSSVRPAARTKPSRPIPDFGGRR